MQENCLEEFVGEDIKAMEGVAVLLMMVHHLFGWPERLGERISYISMLTIWNVPVEMVLAEFGEIWFPVLVFLAGYGIYLACRGKQTQELTLVLWKKILCLYKQYWMVFLVFIPLCILRRNPRVELNLLTFVWNITGMQPVYNGEWMYFTPYIWTLAAYPLLHQVSSRFCSPAWEILAVSVFSVLANYTLPNISDTLWGSMLGGSFAFGVFIQVCAVLPQFWMGCIFAKYSWLTWVKKKLSGNVFAHMGAVLMLVACIGVSKVLPVGCEFAMVSMVVVCATVVLNHKWGCGTGRLLASIGAESTFLWLTHTMFCYELAQSVIFAPKLSVLILLWLLGICLVTAKILRFGMKILDYLWRKARIWLAVETIDAQ